MKTMQLALVLVADLLAFPVLSARGQEKASIDEDGPRRWHRYSYEILSSYPYLKQLPEWSEIPTLLEWVNKKNGDAGVDVAYSQLVALSRVDFGHPQRPPEGGLPDETLTYHRTQRNEAWQHWWKSVGALYAERLRTRGMQHSEGWKLLVRGNDPPVPTYRIAIPDEWVVRTFYRAGDYGGVQTESMTLRRTKATATLIRALRKTTRGRLEWERWEPLTVEQADNVAFGMAYAIDNPWLLKPKTVDNPSRKLEGRNLTLYSPGFRYEFADIDGNTWWNDDPWHWHGGKATEDNFMSTAGDLGSVCLFLWRNFPDNSTNSPTPNRAGWRSVKMPDTIVIQQLVEDLTFQGEIIDTLRNSQRVADGLEALEEFGTMDQIPAISRLETELQSRMEKAKPILESDLNSASLEPIS